jgi:hypothetical protein
MITAVGLAVANGCVIPTPIEPTPDAGRFHPPSFIKGSTQPSFGVFSVNQSPNKTQLVTTQFLVGVEDVDDLPLYARLFVNRPGDYPSYSRPKGYIPIDPELSVALSRGKGLMEIKIAGLCDNFVVGLGLWNLEIYLSDAAFTKDEPNVPDLRVTTGFRVNDLWIINCTPATPTVDGGI